MCDSLCILGADRTVFAKNSDRPPDEVQVVEQFPARAGGGMLRTQYLEIPDTGSVGLIGSRPTWLWGVEHGCNEAGVAIGNEKIWTVDNPRRRPPALLGMDLVRLGLERATTADEALTVMTDLIERYGQGGSGELNTEEPYDSSFLITDAGSAWVLETCNRQWAARPGTGAAALSNRIGLTTDWTRASADVAPGTDIDSWRSPRVATTIADHRLRATTECTRRAGGDPAVADVAAALRDHGTGPWGRPLGDHTAPVALPPVEIGDDHRGVTVCMHVVDYQATTASMIVELDRSSPTNPRTWFLLGSPCVSIFVPVFPAVGVPACLADATTWRRFAALRDRTATAADAFTRARHTLATVEDELWRSADAAAHDSIGQRRMTASIDAVIDRVLTTLGV